MKSHKSSFPLFLLAVLVLFVTCMAAFAGPPDLPPEPQPASFEVEINASRFTDYSITIAGQPLKTGHVYVTQPIYAGYVDLVLTIQDGDETITENITLNLEGGNHFKFTYRVPRLYPSPA